MLKNMFKRIIRTFLPVLIIIAMMSVTVLGDEASDLKKEQDKVLSELDAKERSLAELIIELDKLELQVAEKRGELDKANEELEKEQKNLDKQYADMKLRIRYMYEDQSASISDVILSAASMSDIINRAEYVQKVYEYDRKKLEEIAAAVENINNMKATIQNDLAELENLASSYENKKKALEQSIADMEKTVSDYDSKIERAVQKAAEAAAAAEAERNKQQNNGGGTVSYPTNANNNSAVASAIVADSYKYLGIKYVYGGSSPSGFDCSGFTQYLFKQYGITLPRSAAGQLYAGQKVNGLAEAQPGDIICYAGHVALYIGNNQVIHAPYTGTVVRIQDVNMMKIIGIRRYW